MLNRFLHSFIFWGAWIIIPVLMETVPAIGGFFLLLFRRAKAGKKIVKPKVYPEISIIIPVYNSAQTLYNCIRSIKISTYDSNKIRIFLVNNQGKDNSFEVFQRCQLAFPELHMQWLNAQQGKSRALNLA